MNRIDWLKARRNFICGSDVPAILGLSSFRNIHDIYLSKIETGEPDDSKKTDEQIFGHRMEPVISDEFQARHPELTILKLEENYLVVSHSEPIFGYSPDRVIRVENGTQNMLLGEIKNFHWMMKKRFEDGEIPDAIIAQIQHGMGVMDLKKCWLMVLTGGQNFFDFLIDRDQELIDLMRPKLFEFWDMVQNRTPPPIDGSESCSKLLAKMNRGQKGLTINLDEKNEATARKIIEVSEKIKELEGEKEMLSNQIKSVMGQASGALTPSGIKISWSQIDEKKSFDEKAFAIANPNLYEEFLTKTKAGYRRFQIRDSK